MSKIFKKDPTEQFMLIPNSLIDTLMPALSPAAFKIVCLIYRNTKGWHKDIDQISFSQIMEGTGIKSSATVAKHLSALYVKGIILRAKGDSTWDANSYALNPHFDTFTLKNEVEPTLKNEVEPTLKNKVEPTLKNEVEPTLKNEDTKDTPKKQEIHVPQNGESDFSDLFPEIEAAKIKPGDDKITKLERLDTIGQALLQTFGVLPNQIETDDKIYAIRQEIQNTGWEIRSLDVEMAIAHFVQAVRTHHPEFAIPNDTPTRKDWHKGAAGHLQNYSLDKLAILYKQAIIKMRDADLSFWRPGSLTKWALPEVANEIAQPTQEIDLGKGFYV